MNKTLEKEFLNLMYSGKVRPQNLFKKESSLDNGLPRYKCNGKNTSLIKTFWNSHNQKCFYCQKVTELDEFSLDHKIPRSKGGTNSCYNLVGSCKECNSIKGDKCFKSFIKERNAVCNV